MSKKIFLILFLLLGLTSYCNADSNIIKLPDTTHTNTHILNGSFNGGTPPNGYDEDFSTGYGSDNWRSDGGYELYVISENNFLRPVTLNKISYHLYTVATANGKYTRTHNFYMYVEYKVGGAW